MEESSRSRTAQSGLTEDNDDWRATFTPDFRRKVIDKILGFLRLASNPDGQSQLTKVVEQFEETAFQNAKSKEDYHRTITKRLEMVNKSYPRTAGLSSSKPGLTQKSMVPGGVKSSSLKNAFQASSEFPYDSVGIGMQVNLPASNQSDIPGTQPLQKVVCQINQQKEAQHQFLEHKVQQNTLPIKDIHENHQHQQQQHVLSQPSLFQCSQNQALPTDSRQLPLTEQSNTAVFQQSQLVAQRNNIEQQLSSSWKRMQYSFQQPVPLQTGLSPVASIASATPTEQAKMAESHDQAYQKLQSMKKQYLPWLTLVYNKLNEKCQKSQVPEIVQKYKRTINTVERMLKFLSMPRGDLVWFSMEKLESYHQAVKLFVNSFKQENSVSVQQYAQIHPSGCQSPMSRPQQHTNGEHQFHPVCLALTSTPVGPPPLSSTQQGDLSSQPNMTNSPNSGSLMILKQQNAQSSLQHAARPQGHNIAGTQQTKFSHDSCQKTFVSATNSPQKSSIINPFQHQKQHKHPMMPPQNIGQHLQPQVVQQKMQHTHMTDIQHVPTSGDNQNEVPATILPDALPGMSASLLHNESASLNNNQQSSNTREPLKHLLKAVQSLSPKALSASIGEIDSAIKVVDTIAGAACNVSGATSERRCCLHGRNSSLQYGCSFDKNMECNTDTLAPDALSLSVSKIENLKRSINHISDSDSSVTSRIKRRRIEPSNTLLKEIKYINQRLLETMIDLDSTEDTAAIDPSEGTIVRCIYGAVALDENFKMHYASQMLQLLPLRLLVPSSYPNSSPVILGGLTFGSSSESKELINLSEKMRLRFSLSLRKLSEPVSLEEMAMTWDICARAVLLECAQLVGGGCVSSRYGKWEKCITAPL